MMLRLTLILAVLAPAPLSAERVRAVLVGVSDYAYIDADLEGPFNDVGLMAETLVTRGVAAEDITVLAEEGAVVPAGVMLGAPDRAPILAALNAAIEASTEGDTLIFYFSGHGAQAPDTNGDEGGGFDEIFLPRDTRNWSGGKGAVENAIIDDELSLITEAAAARGVALIGIIDACHSGTGFRAAPEENARARYIQPALLNIPEDTSMEPAAAAPAPPGDYVFLYAAQSDERAFEYPIGEERRWHGDFTLSLTTVMREIPDLTYEGLLEAAKSQMRRNGGKPAQTPDIEGPLANTAVIGGDAPGFERIDLERTTLKAGLTRGVTVGTELTLYADGADGPAGKARVTKVTALTSEIEYLEPFPTVRVSEAEITQRALDTSVRVGLGPGLAVDGLDGFLDFALDEANPTHLLIGLDEGYALVGADGILDPSGPFSSLRLDGADLPALAASLTTAVGRLRVENALAQMSAGGGTMAFSLGTPAEPQVTFSRVEGRVRSGGRCAEPRAAHEASTGAFTHCDRLVIDYANATPKMQDVSVLFVGADHSVTTIWPTRNLSNRIEVGAEKRIAFSLTTPGPILREAIIVVSVPAEPGDRRTVLNFGADGTRGSGDVGTYLAALTRSAPTRSLSLSPSGASVAVEQHDLTITPFHDTGE